MPHLIRSLTSVLLLPILFALPAQADEWVEYRSTNFVVYTDERRDRAEDLLRYFEQFRSAVLMYMNLSEVEENKRMMILMFADTDQFEAFGREDISGYYKQTNSGPRMVLDSMENFSDASVILFHEYAHYLIREHSQQHFPKWYDEGLAEFLASAVIKDDKVMLGALHPWRSHWMKRPRWVGTAELLEPPRDEDSHIYWAKFYAAAWLTVHQLEIGSLFGYPDYSAQTRHYLNLYNQGVNSTDAFRQAFDMTLKDMDRQLRKYRRQRFTKVISFPAKPYEGEIQAQTLNGNQQGYLLADLAWSLGREELAMEQLEQLSPDEEDMAQALALRAVLKGHEEATAAVEAEVQKALELAPKDPQVLVNAAHFYLDRYTDFVREQADPEGPVSRTAFQAKDLEQALHLSEAAVDIDPELEDALYQRVLVLQETDDIKATLQVMMARYQLRPSSVSINLGIGKFLLEKTPRPDLARPFLERAKRWVHSEEGDAEIDKMLEELEERESELAQANEAEAAS